MRASGRSRRFRPWLLAVFAAVLLALPGEAWAAGSAIVVSQVYGGGGNSGATFKNDFVEVFNRGGSPVNLAGWSGQYASSPRTSWAVTNLSGVPDPRPAQPLPEA